MRIPMALAALFLCPVGTSTLAQTPIAIRIYGPEPMSLHAENGRTIPVTFWNAPKPKGVIIFDHGLGGSPLDYQPMIARWVINGYVVIAPQAVDSLANPDREKFDKRAGFMARVEDLRIVREYVAKHFPDLKVALAGHSYGSLFALYGAGATQPLGSLDGPPVAAVLDFSSPGVIPGLVTPTTYKSVAVPMMMVTGDKDLVPGFVANAADHRLPFDTSAAGAKYLVTVNGGTHDLIVQDDMPAYKEVARLGLDFLDAYVAGDAAARVRLAGAKSDNFLTIERR